MKINKLWGILVIPIIAGLWIGVITLFNSFEFAKNSQDEQKFIAKKDIVYVNDSIIQLPEPGYSSDFALEKALYERRSIRSYAKDSITVHQISQILWAAYGVTDSMKYSHIYLKTTPSAGALYPLQVYLLVKKVKGILPGLYQYIPNNHTLQIIINEDLSKPLFDASSMQPMLLEAAMILVFTGDYTITTKKYKTRGERYVHIEAGHAAQNVYLQSTSLGLGTCAIGAFDDDEVNQVLGLPKTETPLYIMPVGAIDKQ